jgi:hypothetical protein
MTEATSIPILHVLGGFSTAYDEYWLSEKVKQNRDALEYKKILSVFSSFFCLVYSSVCSIVVKIVYF